MFALAAAATGTSVPLLVIAKGFSEVHRVLNCSDALARQGLGPVSKDRQRVDKEARQRAGGISGPGISDDLPGYFGGVPSRNIAGDKRKDYEVGGLGNATSSRGMLDDIIGKVPRKTHGSGDYKRICRPSPKRSPGFGNQSATP